ncbi:pyridoxal phosphate (PLP) phosphatase [Anaerotignum neopropionicum]|uniref:Pyridoxal phosphate (PLP) phosphatase n=1 Tax=Anaerotignum neopropionicum TaxID=36847 RepID=A0A136WBL0_9FIRM|nr:HAD hydrolase family protein [Anaerotignum neopropionicum]KXL51719.1 pyridoxal phosphate (PLP) phosphatase [Anaerotignum neopropionicum]
MGYFPRIGMRMIKTAIAVGICFLISILLGGNGKPIFSAIAAIICMQPYVEHSVEVAFNRTIGTVIGAIFGLLAGFLSLYIPREYEYLQYVIISFTIIPVLYTTVLLKKPGASALAGVVLLSITLSSGDATPLMNALNRSLETIEGILVSLGVNMVHLPRRREKDFLFVTGFDGAIYDEKVGITPYCVFELNQLLKNGMAFTIATERTPASLMADIGMLHMELPLIAMDGAVLYDMKERRYLACQGLSAEMTLRIEAFLNELNLHYFLNIVWQDVLLIYYHDFKNAEEEKLYQKLRLSPHRNYVYGERPEEGVVVYILLVVKDEVADLVTEKLVAMDTEKELLFLRDKSETPPDYCHLKIYHKNATKEYMMHRLLEMVPQKKTVVFGSNKNDAAMMRAADLAFVTVNADAEALKAANYQLKGSGDSIVRKIFHLYEPLPWRSLPKELRGEKKKKVD